jgi:hypothetical protein
VTEPICGACHPAHVLDLNPATVIYLCAEHQADYDDHVARTRLASLLQPRQPFTPTWSDLRPSNG